MRDPRVEELTAHDCEAETPVKPDRVRLRAELNRNVPAFARRRDQLGEQHAADAASAPGGNYRHAAEMTVWQQPASTNGIAGRRFREHVQTVLIQAIPLEFHGNMLLLNEYVCPDCSQHVARGVPVNAADSNLRRRIHGYEL